MCGCRYISVSPKNSCKPDIFSTFQTLVGWLQPWSAPKGNGWGLGLELFKALGLCLQCPWWNRFGFYNCSNLTACSQVFLFFYLNIFLWIFGLVVCTNDKSTERRRKEERCNPSVRGGKKSRGLAKTLQAMRCQENKQSEQSQHENLWNTNIYYTNKCESPNDPDGYVWVWFHVVSTAASFLM